MDPKHAGYFRFPTIHADNIAFVSEDDLWQVSASGGEARRLTSGLGSTTTPAYSLDGKWLAFSGKEEGPLEVYVMPAECGQPRRLTFFGATFCNVVGWTHDNRIVCATDYGQPFMKMLALYSISPEPADGEQPKLLPTGPANFASFGPAGECVISRPSVDAAYWKRYRGGTAGDLWIDATNSGAWKRLVKLEGNPSRPLWVGRRIFFISDHEGVGNLYSCTLAGAEITRHTNHQDFYVRNASSDGERIVYHAGADVFVFDTESGKSSRVDIRYHSPRTQRNRKFIDAAKYLESYSPHPKGHLVALNTRGKVATLGNFDGPVQQLGEPNLGRYRLAAWLHDGQRIVAVNDSEGRESLSVHNVEGLEPSQKLEIDVGRIVGILPSPNADQVLLSNVKNEIVLVDLKSQQTKVVDRSEHSFIFGFDFSPDGKWIAYAWAPTPHTSIIRLYRVEDGARFDVTKPVLQDIGPAFDPDGRYLYFLSRREFDPVYDGMHFELGFPKGMRPYLVTLRKDIPSPFLIEPKAAEEKPKDEKKEETPAFSIDTDGIHDRILAFPVPEGIYQQIDGIPGKVLFTSVPVEGALKKTWMPGGEPPAKATLEMFEFATGKVEPVVTGISDFLVSADHKTLVYRAGNRLRTMKAGEKSDDAAAKEPPGRKSGWIDLKRVRIAVEPTREWRQMYGEAWRLQREQFWVEDMADVDWQGVYNRYAPLLDRVSTRNEFHDLLWEMQGELGSSHAYAMGGDFRTEPTYDVGSLGATFRWNANAWTIARIGSGDTWDEENGPPLRRPGVTAREGDTILAINGRRLTAKLSPAQALVNQAGLEAALTVADANGKSPRVVTVRTIRNEQPMRYREWVDKNRAWVHEKTDGRCGYVHVPNMGPIGFAEFHRGYLAEVDRDGLLIDVRFNGGGHVSALLLEKLARRRLAYVQSRWFGVQPWPEDSPAGPMVALTNEFAGSDGDIFSQNFKAMKLGPLIGKRTWGGVIGIWPRHTLVDGGVTTQPEFSFWFRDVGWKVENYGVDPDIEVEIPPQDHVAGKDPQLSRGVEELMKIVESHKGKPEFGPRPSRAWPATAKKG
ncbi:MAG: PDZ domain-containing protein [Anaerolineae bacterium]|nr:PDZ domain-containing protein [Phycisphaerae bacterium]